MKTRTLGVIGAVSAVVLMGIGGTTYYYVGKVADKREEVLAEMDQHPQPKREQVLVMAQQAELEQLRQERDALRAEIDGVEEVLAKHRKMVGAEPLSPGQELVEVSLKEKVAQALKAEADYSFEEGVSIGKSLHNTYRGKIPPAPQTEEGAEK